MTDERQIRVRSGHHPFKRKCWVISLGISVLNFVNLLLKRESAAVVVITAASVFLSLDSCEEIFYGGMNSFGVLVARLILGLRNRRIPPAMTESNAFYKLSFIHLSLF